MSRGAAFAGLVGLLTALALPPAVPLAEPLAPEPADSELLDRVYAESAASDERPGAGWSEYLAFLVRRVAGWFGETLEQVAASSGLDPRLVVFAAWGLLIAAVVALLTVLMVRALRWRRVEPRPVATAAEAAEERPPGLSRWRPEIDRRLAEERIPEALEAAWWWLARSLCGDRADASWTGRELVIHGGRPDLRAPVSRLDAWTYGRRLPGADEVTDWVRGLEPRLPSAASDGAEP